MRNVSEQYEARVALVRVETSPSVLLAGMAGSQLPIVVAHGEGQAQFRRADALGDLEASGGVALRFVDTRGLPAQTFPANPNGSPAAIAAVCSSDGRVTLRCRIRSACSARCRIRGDRKDGPRMAAGCVFFATRACG